MTTRSQNGKKGPGGSRRSSFSLRTEAIILTYFMHEWTPSRPTSAFDLITYCRQAKPAPECTDLQLRDAVYNILGRLVYTDVLNQFVGRDKQGRQRLLFAPRVPPSASGRSANLRQHLDVPGNRKSNTIE